MKASEYYEQGMALANVKNYESAWPYLLKAVANDLLNAEYHVTLGNVASHLSYNYYALISWRNALLLDPDRLYLMGDINRFRERALSFYNSQVSYSSSIMIENLSNLRRSEDPHKSPEYIYDTIYVAKRKLGLSHIRLAYSYFQAENYGGAKNEIEKAIKHEISPLETEENASYIIGVVYAKNKKYNEALLSLNAYLSTPLDTTQDRLSYASSRLYYYIAFRERGLIHQAQNNVDKAVDDFEKSAAIIREIFNDHDSGQAPIDITSVYELQRENKKLEERVTDVKSRIKDIRQAYEKSEFNVVINLTYRALAITSRVSEIHLYKGLAHLHLNETKDAIRCFEKHKEFWRENSQLNIPSIDELVKATQKWLTIYSEEKSHSNSISQEVIKKAQAEFDAGLSINQNKSAQLEGLISNLLNRKYINPNEIPMADKNLLLVSLSECLQAFMIKKSRFGKSRIHFTIKESDISNNKELSQALQKIIDNIHKESYLNKLSQLSIKCYYDDWQTALVTLDQKILSKEVPQQDMSQNNNTVTSSLDEKNCSVQIKSSLKKPSTVAILQANKKQQSDGKIESHDAIKDSNLSAHKKNSTATIMEINNNHLPDEKMELHRAIHKIRNMISNSNIDLSKINSEFHQYESMAISVKNENFFKLRADFYFSQAAKVTHSVQKQALLVKASLDYKLVLSYNPFLLAAAQKIEEIEKVLKNIKAPEQSLFVTPLKREDLNPEQEAQLEAIKEKLRGQIKVPGGI